MKTALRRRIRRLVGSGIVLAGAVIFAADMSSFAIDRLVPVGTLLAPTAIATL